MTTLASRLIARLEQFSPLTLPERIALEDAAVTVRRFAPREELARQGAPVPAVLAIYDGFACRYRTLPDGRRQIVGFLMPGDISDPRMFLFDCMDHSVATLGPVEAALLERESVQRLENYPGLTRAMAGSAVVQDAIGREWLMNVGHRSSFERISHLFCEIYARLQAVGLVREHGCDVPLTQADIADAMAITPVHVNRTLMELRRTGLLTFHSKRLVIHDLQALAHAAGFDASYLRLRAKDPSANAPGRAALLAGASPDTDLR
jgi:CRP-like cAMP-binding protein